MNKFTSKILGIVLFLGMSAIVYGQTYVTPTAGETETFSPAVGEIFTDPGGPGGDCSGSDEPGNYPNCGCITITTLDGVYGIDFLTYGVNNTFDNLTIYDGTTTSDPIIFESEPEDIDDIDELLDVYGTTVFFGSSGALTFEFDASTVVNRCGWETEILEQPQDPCVLDCPDDITVSNDPGECGAFVDLDNATFSGECSSPVFLLDEGFDACDQPSDWDVVVLSGSASTSPGSCGDYISFDCTEPDFFTSDENDNFEGCIAEINDDSEISTDAVVAFVSPQVDLSSVPTTPTFSVDYLFNEISDSEFRIEMFDGSSWVTEYTATEDEAGTFEMDLDGYTNSDFQVRMVHDDADAWAYGLAIDNAQISYTSSPVVMNDFNDSDDAAGFYPVGETVVEFSVLDANGQEVTCTTTVTVEDDESPMIDCPDDQTITLDPGACEYIYNYEVIGSDNCPGPLTTFDQNGDDVIDDSGLACAGFFIEESHYARVYDLVEEGITNDFPLTEVDVGVGGSFGDTWELNVYTATSQDLSTASLTEIYSTDFDVDGFQYIETVPVDVTVPSGSIFVVEIQTDFNSLMGHTIAPELDDSWFAAPLCDPNYATVEEVWTGAGIAPPVHYPYITVTGQGPVTPEMVSGAESGEPLGIGTHTFEWMIEDAAGNTNSCSWAITVEEYPNPITELACNDNVNISVDPGTCEALITPDMILEGGPYGCYDDYIVELYDQNGNPVPNPVTGPYIGEQLEVHITDPDGTIPNNTCWGYVTVEDKTIPALECMSQEINCGVDPLPGSFIDGSVEFPSDQNGEPITGDGLTANVPVGPSEEVIDVNVIFNIDHTWIGDLAAEVTSPSGTTVQLFHKPGTTTGGFGCSADDIDVIFDDAAVLTADDFENACPPTDDESYQPMDPLAAFNGESMNGNWTVDIIDDFPAGDDGVINYIALEIEYENAIQIVFPVPPDATVNPSSGNGPFVVEGFDPCGDVTLTYEDNIVDHGCSGDYASTIYRNWTATDESGNTATCQDTFNVVRSTLTDISLPPNYDGQDEDPLSCVDGYPDPSVTGNPGTVCENIVSTPEDLIIDVCDGSYKILRRWTLLDWCTSETLTHTQIIKVVDETGPVVVCPPDMTISTDFDNCSATLSVPAPTDIYDECSDEVDYTINASAGNVIDYGGNTYVVTDLPVGNHVVTYVAEDGCGNTTSCEMEVTVEDQTAPVALCDVSTRLSLGTDGVGRVYVQSLDDGSYDNCGVDRVQVRRKDDGNCPAGVVDDDDIWRDYVEFCCNDIASSPILVEMAVWDESGNSNQCWVEIEVEDKLPPFITCPPDITVSCDYPFDLWNLDVFGKVVPIPSSVKVVGFLPILPNPDYPHNTIVFNSKDREYYRNQFGSWIGYDEYEGTEYEAPDSIIIDDPTYVEECQGGVYSGPQYWGRDGYSADNCNLTISETYNSNLECGQGRITRIFTATDDGGRSSTCIQNIYVEDCDPFYINPDNPFDPFDDVVWPTDRNLTNQCMNADTDPENTGEPQVDDDNCSQIAVTYEDEVFQVQDSACFKIVRRWVVIDWCQYNENTDEGRWEYTQIIKVNNTNPPQFDPCEDVTFCDTVATECSGLVDLVAPVEDDCTPFEDLEGNYRIFFNEEGADEPASCNNTVNLNVDINDITNRVTISRTGVINSPVLNDDIVYSTDNGTTWNTYFSPFIISNPEDLLVRRTVEYADGCETDVTMYGHSLDASRYYPYGTHKIQWSAEDVCGNRETCQHLITVEDCKKPTPVCINGVTTVVMPASGIVTIDAESFDASSFDNCTANNDLIFTFSSDIDSTSMEMTCDDLGTIEVEIWVTDEYGNQDYCTTYLILEDNDGVCGNASIAGEIENENSLGVQNAEVLLENNNPDLPSFMTTYSNQEGHFTFHVPMHWTYNVSVSHDVEPLNGVSTYDIVKIQKHILGLEYLDSGYKLIAADVNDNGTISAIDIVELRKLILGIYSEFPNNESWRFVDAEYEFENNITQPPADYPEIVTYEPMDEPQLATDFVGVKIGDVTNNANPNNWTVIEDRNEGVLQFVSESKTIEEGDEVTIPIRADQFNDVTGMQTTFEFDQKAMAYKGFESGVIELKEGNFGTHLTQDGILTFSWDESSGMRVKADEVLFTLVFDANQTSPLSEVFDLSSTITTSEAYNSSGDHFELNMRWDQDLGTEEHFALYQNVPNPFDETTRIGFILPRESDATITIYDVSGKNVYQIEEEFNSGYNEIELSRDDVPSSGVLYYELRTDKYTATKRMIIQE